MFVGICVGGWDKGVGEVVVFSMGTRLLTAAKEIKGKKSYIEHRYLGFSRHFRQRRNSNKKSTYLP